MTARRPSDALPGLLLAKLREQVERTEHLLELIPPDQIDWRPELPAGAPLRLSEVVGHLLECLAGFCAAFYAVHPERLSHFLRLRERQVNHRCGVDEARQRIEEYMRHIEQGFALTTDADLARPIPTAFVPQGEALLTVLLGNLEHLINHKHQLFFYLKMLGVPVGTRDLYHWRGSEPKSGPAR
ncbi:MAG TPA: DinB family protein [Bryobacterales bacterium]|nr:DinB family protein [Bryobacterales bacterium]